MLMTVKQMSSIIQDVQVYTVHADSRDAKEFIKDVFRLEFIARVRQRRHCKFKENII